MRNIAEVIDLMIAEIPNNYPNKDIFISQLESIKLAAMFTAPEIMSFRWQQVYDVLISKIGEPKEDWQKNIADIFSGY